MISRLINSTADHVAGKFQSFIFVQLLFASCEVSMLSLKHVRGITCENIVDVSFDFVDKLVGVSVELINLCEL